MQRRSELAPILFLLCFDLVHRLDLLYTVGGRYLSAVHSSTEADSTSLTTIVNLDLDSRREDVYRRLQTVAVAGHFLLRFLCRDKEVEWTVGSYVSDDGCFGADRAQELLSAWRVEGIISGMAPAQNGSFFFMGWGKCWDWYTSVAIFVDAVFSFSLRFEGSWVLKSRTLRFCAAFSGVRGGSCFGLHCFVFLCVYTWACILYHEVAGDNPLGCCRHELVGHVCSWRVDGNIFLGVGSSW